MFFTKKIINRDNLISNINFAKKISNKKICAVVKANAYGHGAEVVTDILRGKADFFAVQNITEALEIRHKNKDIPILVLGMCYLPIIAIENDISIMIDDADILKKICEQSKGKRIKIHIKINSGMNRLGVNKIKKFKEILKVIKENKNIVFEGIYTHFFSPKNKQIVEKQMKVFLSFISHIPKPYKPIRHVGGSNLVYADLPEQIDMIRVGLMLYGYGSNDVAPVMKIVSKIVKVTEVKRGEYIGYDERYIASEKMRIAIVPIGYADGFSRDLAYKTIFSVNCMPCKIVGLVCMDMFMLDVTKTTIEAGKEIVVFDSASKWGKVLGKSEYEILTSLNMMRSDVIVTGFSK